MFFIDNISSLCHDALDEEIINRKKEAIQCQNVTSCKKEALSADQAWRDVYWLAPKDFPANYESLKLRM